MNKAKLFLIFLPILLIGNKEFSQTSNLLPNSFFNFFNQKVYANDLIKFFKDSAYSKSMNGNHYGALDDLNKAIEIEPKNPDLYHLRGSEKVDIKDYSGAMRDFEKALTLDTENVFHFLIYQSIGMLKNDLKDYESAISYLDKSLVLMPSLFTALEQRGYAKFRLKDYLGAINDYDKYISYNPNNSKIYMSLLQAKVAIDKYRDACLDGKKAISLGYEDTKNYVETLCGLVKKHNLN